MTEGARVTLSFRNFHCIALSLSRFATAPSRREPFVKLLPTEKHHQRNFLGGVRCFSAKVAEAKVLLFFFICGKIYSKHKCLQWRSYYDKKQKGALGGDGNIFRRRSNAWRSASKGKRRIQSDLLLYVGSARLPFLHFVCREKRFVSSRAARAYMHGMRRLFPFDDSGSQTASGDDILFRNTALVFSAYLSSRR